MPKKLYKPCSRPNCPELTSERYCMDHRQHYNKYDKWRGSASSRGYNAQWRKARVHFLRRNPLCVICEAKGIVEPATVVDHITSHRGDKKLFWDAEGNWQALCASCHSRKTVTQDGVFGTSIIK